MIVIKLWIDGVHPASEGYVWRKTINSAKRYIKEFERLQEPFHFDKIEVIDIDHDAGMYSDDGGDYIKLLDWLEETGRNYPIRIRSMNVVGVANMRRIIERNGWKEIR